MACSSGVGSRSGLCPVAMSMIDLASWLGSRGRLRFALDIGRDQVLARPIARLSLVSKGAFGTTAIGIAAMMNDVKAGCRQRSPDHHAISSITRFEPCYDGITIVRCPRRLFLLRVLGNILLAVPRYFHSANMRPESPVFQPGGVPQSN